MLAEMGVAIGVDGHTVGLFQPRRVCYEHSSRNVILFTSTLWACQNTLMTMAIRRTEISDDHSSCLGVLLSLTKKDSTTPKLS